MVVIDEGKHTYFLHYGHSSNLWQSEDKQNIKHTRPMQNNTRHFFANIKYNQASQTI